MAIWRVRERRTWLLAGLTAFSLIMALGNRGCVYALARRVLPVVGFMRFPIKFVVLATFAIPLLAAQALGWWQSSPDEQWRMERRKLWRIGGLLPGLMAIILWWEWLIRRPAQDDPLYTTENAVVRAIFLALILCVLAMLRHLENRGLQTAARVGLLLLFWFDVFTNNPKLSPTVERAAYDPDLIRQYFNWEGQLGSG